MQELSSPANAETPDFTSHTINGYYEREKAAEMARKALAERPRFTFRAQVFLGFLTAFIFVVAIAATLIYTIYLMESKVRFLEIAQDYVSVIEQARRFEKNYFLYGTNLPDALESVFQAKMILEKNSGQLKSVMGAKTFDVMEPQLNRYEELLGELIQKHQNGGLEDPARKKKIELELRRHGQGMVSFAQDLMKKERVSLSKMIRQSRWMHIYSLGFLFLLMILITYLLEGRIMGTIKRFSTYAERIAGGDYTPIMPVRRFRDEFSDLAIVINDMIVKLEKREEILVQSHKMRAMGTLTAGVAHELNNPLNNILLTANVLMEDYKILDDEDRDEMIRDMAKEAERAKIIIRDLLDYSQESPSTIVPLDLKVFLNQTIVLVSKQTKFRRIKIEMEADEHLPRIYGDNNQLTQVFLNLILNAADASPEGGKILVRAGLADEPNFIAVKVIDYGTGIPKHIIGSIFDPFFTTKTGEKGTGLGLSVSQGIINKHGGRISVTSQEGEGTTFTVTLPAFGLTAEIRPQRSNLV